MKRILLLALAGISLAGGAQTHDGGYPITPVPFTSVKVTDSFWGQRLKASREVTIPLAFSKCEETGRYENFAKAAGTRANAYNLLIAVVIAVIIVLAMNLVGSLLISALVIFPALSAMRLFKSFRSVTISAAVLSVLSATAGILISILAGTPVGSTIVAVDIAVFLISYGIGRITGR